jgi:hypothetical protein
MGNKRLSYTMSFKLEVVHCAEKPGKIPAVWKFDVNKPSLRECCKQKEKLENAP